MSATDGQLAGGAGVILPAGGAGLRMGGVRKQFRLLGGRPLLVHTLHVFDRHPAIDHLFVAVPADAVEDIRQILRHERFIHVPMVVAGGASRQESVAAALAAVPSSVRYLLVHDAVRPFVTPGQVERVLQAVRRHGAAALAIPAADTMRQGHEGVFGETVPREHVFRMQTPQGFRVDWLREAHERARCDGVTATDEVGLVQRLGYTVRIVIGSGLNFKITTPEDWALAQVLFDTMSGATES